MNLRRALTKFFRNNYFHFPRNYIQQPAYNFPSTKQALANEANDLISVTLEILNCGISQNSRFPRTYHKFNYHPPER